MSVTFSELGKKGRLGNILFQAAATIALALRNNDDYVFPDNWPDKQYFNIPLNKFAKKVYYSNKYNEQHFYYSPIPYQPNLNWEGYGQSYLYFNDFKEQIRQLLTPNIEVEKQNYTSIHVRRTDYLIHKNCYNILTRKNYYDKAMELSGGEKFLIFSDQIDWCKENFKGNDFDFAEGNNAPMDLKLMANCLGGNIIANSSFSWWGAYLNDICNVIAPKTWFGPELEPTHNTKDLYLPEWIKV